MENEAVACFIRHRTNAASVLQSVLNALEERFAGGYIKCSR